MLSESFASILDGSQPFRISQVPKPLDGEGGNLIPPAVKERVRAHLKRLNAYRSMRHDNMRPRVLRGLPDATAVLLSSILDKPGLSGKSPVTGRTSQQSRQMPGHDLDEEPSPVPRPNGLTQPGEYPAQLSNFCASPY